MQGRCRLLALFKHCVDRLSRQGESEHCLRTPSILTRNGPQAGSNLACAAACRSSSEQLDLECVDRRQTMPETDKVFAGSIPGKLRPLSSPVDIRELRPGYCPT